MPAWRDRPISQVRLEEKPIRQEAGSAARSGARAEALVPATHRLRK